MVVATAARGGNSFGNTNKWPRSSDKTERLDNTRNVRIRFFLLFFEEIQKKKKQIILKFVKEIQLRRKGKNKIIKKINHMQRM